MGQAQAQIEQAYRIVVDELSLDSAASNGLTFVLLYSVPVIIQGMSASTPALLKWHLEPGPKGNVLLTISNSGTTRAKLSDLKFTINKGQTLVINQGLFGYALANSARQWSISRQFRLFASGGTFHAVINGKTLQVSVAGFGL